jgi:hypothetical protein
MAWAHTEPDGFLRVATVPHRELCLVLALVLLPAEVATSAEPAEWAQAPRAWKAGLDYSALCGPGEWWFDAFGEEVSAADSGTGAKPRDEVSATGPTNGVRIRETSVTKVFFGKLRFTSFTLSPYAVKDSYLLWLRPGPKADELTDFRIARNDVDTVTIEAFAGTTRAGWRVHRHRSFVPRNKTDTKCQPGRHLELQLAYDGMMATEFEPVHLALAADGSLLVGVTDVGFLKAAPIVRFARFPATRARDGAPPPLE